MQLPDWAVQYWVVWAFGLLTACLAALWRYALAQHKRQKALETGVQALLRDRIIQSCDYYQKKQSISVHGRENIQSMYAAYHALGGNGTVTALVHDVGELPTHF